MIKFSVSALDKAPVKLAGTLAVAFLELDENDPLQITDEIKYELCGTKVSGGVLVTGCCSTAVSGICGRCLEPVTQALECGIKLFFDLEESVEELDISGDIREEILLASPMNLLCSDECAGLCRNCGANLNKGNCQCDEKVSGDFRWSALDDLKL